MSRDNGMGNGGEKWTIEVSNWKLSKKNTFMGSWAVGGSCHSRDKRRGRKCRRGREERSGV